MEKEVVGATKTKKELGQTRAKEKNFRSVTKTTGMKKVKQGEEHTAIKKIDESLFIEAMAGPKKEAVEAKLGKEPEKELKKEESLK